MKFKLYIPQYRLYLILLPSLLVAALAIFISQDQTVLKESIRVGSVITSGSEKIILKEIDFTAEPGAITEDSKLDEFYYRQEKISNLVKMHENVEKRKFSDLPLEFWMQIIVGLGAIFITSTVWAFSPKKLANIFFLLSGIATLLFTNSAAIYTTRELFLDKDLFLFLSGTNSFGASLYGMTTLALFSVFPKKILHFKKLFFIQVIVFGTWTFLAVFRLIDAQYNVNLVTSVEMLAIISMILTQWFLTKRDPENRASLIWIGTAFTLGAGSFIFLNALPLAIGQKEPWLNQSVGFLFFLLIYLGIAAGLFKYRLFDIGRWSFHITFNSLAIVCILALDALFVSIFNFQNASAIGLSIVSVSFLYLPFKSFFWKKIIKNKSFEPHEILDFVLKMTLSPTSQTRQIQWLNFIECLYSPLEIITLPKIEKLKLEDNGLSMTIPSLFEETSQKIKYRDKGKSLFSPDDIKTLSQIIHLLKRAEDSREAYEKGILTERKRLAQDLHDDIGSQLLTGMHLSNGPAKEVFHEALEKMQIMISNLSQDKISLSEILSILRYETVTRLSLVDISVKWELFEETQSDIYLNYHQHKTLTSSVREIVSNTMKYSEASSLIVLYKLDEDFFNISFRDDGIGFSEHAASLGNGISNIKRRMEKIEGECILESNFSEGCFINLKFKLTPS